MVIIAASINQIKFAIMVYISKLKTASSHKPAENVNRFFEVNPPFWSFKNNHNPSSPLPNNTITSCQPSLLKSPTTACTAPALFGNVTLAKYYDLSFVSTNKLPRFFPCAQITQSIKPSLLKSPETVCTGLASSLATIAGT